MTGFIGFVLAALTGGCTGAFFSRRLGERCDSLNCYIGFIQSMSAYIRYNGYRLSEILRKEQATCGFIISDNLIAIAESGSDIRREWNSCVDENSNLRVQDRQVLYHLGEVIGKSDTEGEIASLSAAESRLRQCLQNAEEERSNKGRLYCTVGIMLGAAVGIILI